MQFQLQKQVSQLQSEIVKSPDKYEMRIKELEKQHYSKDKERKTLEEACKDKKHLLEQQTNILNFVQKQYEESVKIVDIHHQLKYFDYRFR